MADTLTPLRPPPAPPSAGDLTSRTPRPPTIAPPTIASPTIAPATLVPASVAPPTIAPATIAPPSVDPTDLGAPALFLNRELSWLQFNSRVLAEAMNEAVPLLERLKFHAIVASNLDEFYMVRIAGLKQQLTGEAGEIPPDGMTVAEQLAAIASRVHEMAELQTANLTGDLFPRLAEQHIVLLKPGKLPPAVQAALDQRFHDEIFPILTPIAIDPGHPFPHLRNKSLNLGVTFQREGASEPGFGVVQVPMMLPRLLEVPGQKHAYVLLEDLIARHVGAVFPTVHLKNVYVFRVTRNFDMEIDEEEADDLLQTIQQELRRRERGNAVRLEVAGDPTPATLAKLVKALKLDPDRDVYRTTGMLNVSDLMQIVSREDRRELRDEPFTAMAVPPFRDSDDLFATIREQDVLLLQPYESFDAVVDLITRAADDPDVLAIKQTLYRAGGDSPIVKALARAAESGKQVTAIVELKARFDEESNIHWARTLEQSGVHVVYGLLGLKTHAKCLLIVRREKGLLKRYVHMSTGNYNPSTARLYTDVSFFTSRPHFGEDASSLFNLLTGYSAPPRWNSLIVSPLGMHEAVLGLIAREGEHARLGRPARIVAKMNSLVDADVIEALYRASQLGVQITLLIRGVCCLRPGVPKVSQNIEVLSMVDRFLEHSRVLYLANGGKDEVYISSADWMPRNFHRRVEIMLPIEDGPLRVRLMDFLTLQAHDTAKSWRLASDGTYVRIQPAAGVAPVRCQARFIEMAREKVKGAETAGAVSGRFHLMHTRPNLDRAPDGRPRRRRKGSP